MAKRPRRKAVILESEDDDDDSEDKRENAKASSDIRLASTQSGKTLEVRSERKHRKSAERMAKNSLTEPKKKVARKKAPHGTLPLDIISVPTRNTGTSSKSQKGADDEERLVNQSVDYRLWVDKYAPKNVGELVVHSKKVAEVKDWLEDQLLKPYGSHQGGRVLVLTGPAGAGKTAVVRVLADLLRLELLEWRTPAPESWQEYSHRAASGGPYVSKLDEFESFLERGRKMTTLPVVSVTSSSMNGDDVKERGAKVLFIDDLPVVSNRDHHRRLVRSLGHLAVSREFPAIVVITDETGDGGRLRDIDNTIKDILETLEREGAKKIAFNPVTVNAMKKLLRKLQVLEKCRLSTESLSNVAETSAGDIRQALTSLQFLSLGCQSNNPHHLLWDPGGLPNSQSDTNKLCTNSQAATVCNIQSVASIAGGRDYSLALFHALGKLLHNKRHTDEPFHAGNGTVSQVKEELQRHRLNMAEPEVILLQAHAETATILGFLHENVLEFIDEDAADDVAAVSAYFSDTDCLLGAQGGFRWRRTVVDANQIDPSQVTSAAANSVVARGILFGNSHPAPRRWQSLRAPYLWQVERQFRQNKIQGSTQSAHGVHDATEIFSLLLQRKDLSIVSQGPYRHSLPSSRSHAGITTSITGSSEVEDLMELDEYEGEDDGSYLPLVQQHKPSTEQGSVDFERTFMQMYVEDVEDDIEDADD